MEAVEVIKAQKKEPPAPPPDAKEEKPEVTLEAGDEEEEEESGDEKPSDDDLTEEQLDEAKRVYKALNSNQAAPFIAALAQQAGILNKPLETKGDEVKAKKEITAIIKEYLGKDYEWLGDKIGPAIEKVLSQEREERQSEMQALYVQNVEREVVSALSAIARETKGESKKLEKRMEQLAQELPSTPDISIKKYVNYLYKIAAAEGTRTTTKEKNDTIRRNAGDAPSRLHATSGVKESDLPKGKMNINQAVAWALEHEAKREGH